MRRRLLALFLGLALLAAGSAAAGPLTGGSGPRKAKAAKLARAKALAQSAARVKRGQALTSANLFANGGFDTSLTGWGGYRAVLSLASDGVGGGNAAKVTLSGTNL